jgi:hypothetical protein
VNSLDATIININNSSSIINNNNSAFRHGSSTRLTPPSSSTPLIIISRSRLFYSLSPPCRRFAPFIINLLIALGNGIGNGIHASSIDGRRIDNGIPYADSLE